MSDTPKHNVIECPVCSKKIAERWRQKLHELKAREVPPENWKYESDLDEIAILCGCKQWDYSGQLIRDVALLAAYFEETSGLPIAELYKSIRKDPDKG